MTSISLDAPYEIVEIDENTTVFFTGNGIKYIVGFVEDESLGIDNVYQIYLTKDQSDKVIGTDPDFGKTLVAFLLSFFRNKDHVLTCVCDVNDRHQAARDRKFKT